MLSDIAGCQLKSWRCCIAGTSAIVSLKALCTVSMRCIALMYYIDVLYVSHQCTLLLRLEASQRPDWSVTVCGSNWSACITSTTSPFQCTLMPCTAQCTLHFNPMHCTALWCTVFTANCATCRHSIQHSALRCTYWRVAIIVGKDLIAANTLEQRNSSNGSIIISIMSMSIDIDQHRHQQLYHVIHEWIEKWEYLYRRRSRWSVSSQKYWNIFTWTIREGYKYKGISISIRE